MAALAGCDEAHPSAAAYDHPRTLSPNHNGLGSMTPTRFELGAC